MAIQKLAEGFTWAGPAGEDLSNSVNRLMALNSDGEIVTCGNDAKALGALFEAAASGAPATVYWASILKVVSGGSITRGQRVSCGANGLAKAGTTNPVGIALNSVSTGGLVSIAAVG